MSVIQSTCAQLGVPLEVEKSEGPTSCLVFLGMELDSRDKTIRLPQEKLTRLQLRLEEWGNRKEAGKRDLLSLLTLVKILCKGYIHRSMLVMASIGY